MSQLNLYRSNVIYNQFLIDRKIHTIESIQENGIHFWTVNDIDQLKALMNLQVPIIVKSNGFFACLVCNHEEYVNKFNFNEFKYLNKQDLKNFIKFYNAPSNYFYSYISERRFLKYIYYAKT